MKRFLSLFLIAGLVLGTTALLSSISDTKALAVTNLIANGDFESTDENDFPTGWDSDGKNLIPDGSFETGTASWSPANTSAADITFDVTKKRTGNNSLKIAYKSTQTSQTWAAARSVLTHNNKKIVVNAGEVYRLRAYFNVSGCTTESYAMLSFQIDDSTGVKKVGEGGVSAARYQQDTASGTDWDKKELDYTIPASVGQGGKLYLIAARTNGMSGMIAYVDDVAIEKLGRVDKTTGYNSPSSLKIVGYSGGYLDSSTPPNEDSWHTASDTAVTPGDILNYTYKVKTTGSGNAFIRFVFKDSLSNIVGTVEGDRMSNLSDWTDAAGQVEVPAGAVCMSTSLVVTPGMTAWFDNLCVTNSVPVFNFDQLLWHDGEELTATADMRNPTGEPSVQTMMVALYNKADNVLKSVSVKNYEIPAGQTLTGTVSLVLPSSDMAGYYAKAFVWNGMTPMCRAATLDGEKASNTQRPDYYQTVTTYYDRFTAAFNTDTIKKDVDACKVRGVCDFLASAAVMFMATGNEKYLDMCTQTWNVMAAEWRNNPRLMRGTDDFFAPPQLAKAYKLMKDRGRIGNENDDLVLKFIDDIIDTGFVTDNNQAQERALGAARGANLFPGTPQAEKWNNYVDTIWNQWYPNRDIDEDATNYCAVHIRDVIYIAKETGREELLNDPDIRKWLERYRDQQAPSGFMPEYGDDYFFAFEKWVFNFEYAARLFNDPSFLEAAWRLFAVGMINKAASPEFQKEGLNYSKASDISVLAEVLLLPQTDLKPETVKVGSVVTTRTNKNGLGGIYDQMLLAPSRQPGVPFVMSDLYGSGSHGHVNGRGSIQYYEVDNNPLFHGLNRRSIDGRQNNTVVLVHSDDGGFPFDNIPGNSTNPNRAATNIWYTDGVDMSLSPQISQEDTSMRGFSSITFRFQGKAGMKILISNIRLEGAAGQMILDDCTTLKNWKSSACSLVTDTETGKKAVQVALSDSSVYFIGASISKQFSLNDYDTIKFDWKHTTPDGSSTSSLWTVVRVNNIVTPPGESTCVEVTPATMPNANKVTKSFVQTKGQDCYGEIHLDHQFTADSQLKRRILLTEEGVLVLQDYLTPGPSTSGYVAGELWYLYQLNEQGNNWFNSPGEVWYSGNGHGQLEKKELLVYYENKGGRTFGCRQGDFAMLPQITFSKQAVTPGTPITFLTVLVPHSSYLPAQQIAGSIAAQTTGDMESNVSLSLEGRTIVISLHSDGTWDVSRN